MSRTLNLCFALLLAPAALFAQGWPLPAKTQNTEVPCNPCPGYTRKDLKTVGYQSPILSFTGRFLDSQRTSTYQQPFRTARGQVVAINAAKNRIYMLVGSAVFAYDMNTFFTRLANGEKLMSSQAIPVAGQPPHADPHEQLLKYDEYFYAENGSPWPTFIVDGQQRLFGFDWDDQGYMYLAYSTFGWGIVKDDGGSGGGLMDYIYSDRSAGEPAQIAYLKASDGRSYVSLTGGSIYDVTDRAHPVFVRKGPTFQSFARNTAGDRIGIVDGVGQISIYTPDNFVSAGAPIRTFSSGVAGGFNLITTDGTNFYGDAWAAAPVGNTIAVIQATGNTYTQRLYSTDISVSRQGVFASGFQYGAGFLVFAGISNSAWDIAIYRVDGNGVPTKVDINQYVRSYYSSAPDANHVVPQAFINIDDAVIVKFGTKYYLIIEAGGLGDVYEFRGADTVNANFLGSAGTRSPDPLVTSAAATGPFYGDKLKFSSDASTTSPIMVTWNFDNAETAADPNSVSNIQSGTSIIHQFSGMTPATLASRATRSVSATNMADSTMSGSVGVTLKTPAARFGILGSSLLFKQPDASSTAPIVAGDKFIDASDGDVEGHWINWTIDGVSTKTVPYSPADLSYRVDVGACGVHTLNFDTHYGPYSGAGATLATVGAADFPVNVDGFRYAVLPFASGVSGPAADPANGNNILFTSGARATTDRTLLTSTGVTYRWDLVTTAGGVDTVIVAGPATAPADIAGIPSWSVAKANVVAGSRARLTITSVQSAGTCVGLNNSAGYSVALNPPPVGMSITGGCTNGAPPCNFQIAGLPADTSGYAYKWTGTGPGTVNSSNTTSATFSPTFSAIGDYTLQVVVTNLVGSQTLLTNPPVHVSKIVSCSDMNALSTFIDYHGQSTACTGTMACSASENISFTIATFNGYNFACNTHSFTWNFDDGSGPQTLTSPAGANTAPSVTHKLPAGSHTVTCVIDNGAQQYTASVNVLVNNGVQPPPPPPPPPPTTGNCATMQPGLNVFFTYQGATTHCADSNTTPCGTGEQITFTASAFLYNFACATHTFNWNFGDGTTGTGISQTHAFSAARTYNVTLAIGNGSQTVTVPLSVPVGGNGSTPPPPPPPSTGCATMQPNVNVFVAYQGDNGCSFAGGKCVAGQAITFSASGFNYNFGCATHTFSWDFGDTHTGSGNTLTHTFAIAGNYNVALTISNGAQSVTIPQPVHIDSSSGVTPGASFDFTITPLTVHGTTIPNAYVFNATSTPAGAFSTFNWDFGDNSCPGPQPCSGASVSHIFADNKNYTITLTVPGQPNGVSKTLVLRHRATGRR